MAYSSEQIQASVERLLRAGIRKPVDIHGVRNVEVQWDDIREIAAGVFITYPNSPYYLMMLGFDRLHGMVQGLLQDMATLNTQLEATGRRTYPINDLSSLADATTALTNLESALTTRAGASKDPTQLPAYQQWSSSSAKYLNMVGRSVKEGGQFVSTPTEAKGVIPSLFAKVMAEYQSILEYQHYLQLAAADYAAMSLPAMVVQNVVTKARTLLAEDQAELESLSEAERLAVATDKTLNALSAKAIVDAYVQGQRITSALGLTGTVLPYADDAHLAEPAIVSGTLPGPYALVSYPVAWGAPPSVQDNNRLIFTVDGSLKPVEIILPTSFVAFMVGNGQPQPIPDYDPNSPAPPIVPADPTRLYTFYKDGTDIGADPSPNGPHYCENWDPSVPEQWFFPKANDVLYVEQIIEGGATTRFMIPLVIPGVDPITTFQFPVPATPPDPPLATQDWTGYKVQLTLQQVLDRINAVLSGSYLKAYVGPTGGVEIRCDDAIACVKDRVVGIRIPKVVVGTVETNTAAQNPLGFVLGLAMMSRRTPALSILNYVNSNTSRVVASLVAYPRVPSFNGMHGWTTANDPAGMTLAKYTGYAAVTVSGATATFTLGTGFDPFSTWGVGVGDVICLPTQWVQNLLAFEKMTDEGARYRVTHVAGTVMEAVHVAGPMALAYPMRAFDVGMADVLDHLVLYDVVQCLTTPNDGAYEVTAIDALSPFRVRFDTLLSQSKQTNEPLPLELTLVVGPASLAFASTNLGTTSAIAVAGSCRPLIFPTAPSARGQTNYVQLPAGAPKMTVTDKLTFSDSTKYERSLKNVEERVLTLDSPVSCALSWVGSAASAPSVFAVSGPKTNVDNKTVELAAWEAAQPDVATYSANMNAKLNPLLANYIPAAGRISDAKAGLQELTNKVEDLGALSEVQLTGPAPDDTPTTYYVEPITAVDDLLETLKARGCDRAVDILLMGRFSEFFGFDIDDMSYAGTMMKAARDVARNDLAVSKFGAQRVQRRVLSISEGTDPDYDYTDSFDAPSPPDVPTGADME